MITQIIFIVAFFFSASQILAQQVYTILPDSSKRYYTQQDLMSHRDQCVDGTRIYMNPECTVVIVESEMKDCHLHGAYKQYYLSGKLKMAGRFVNGDKDNEWLYWDKKGTLTKREQWSVGKLLQEENY